LFFEFALNEGTELADRMTEKAMASMTATLENQAK